MTMPAGLLTQLVAEIEALTERAERAETALREIANANPAFGYDTFMAKWWSGVQKIARTALGETS